MFNCIPEDIKFTNDVVHPFDLIGRSRVKRVTADFYPKSLYFSIRVKSNQPVGKKAYNS